VVSCDGFAGERAVAIMQRTVHLSSAERTAIDRAIMRYQPRLRSGHVHQHIIARPNPTSELFVSLLVLDGRPHLC
jgi:hypothetical protein